MKRGTTTTLQLLIWTVLIGAAVCVCILLIQNSAARNTLAFTAVENGYITKAVHRQP